MSLDTIFTAGSLARAYHEIAEWYGIHANDIQAETILVPFFGFGRLSSAMCNNGTTIDTVDYLKLSACIVNGIFAAKEFETNVDKPRFRKGKAVAGDLMKYGQQPDLHSAGFIDWVREYGTALDVACVGMAIPGQTYHGYLSKWTGDFDHFWRKFCQIREDCRRYISLPGQWNHFEADIFQLLSSSTLPRRDSNYDLLAIDPPRLCSDGKDLYSTGGWVRLNEVLGGSVKIQLWSEKNYFHQLSLVLNVPSKYILFTWTEGQPRTKDVKELLLQYGTLEDEEVWHAYNKTIYGWRIRRSSAVRS